MVATMNDTMLGTEIGRYRLTRLLGEGGMGRVYLAEQPAIGSRVAIKVLSEECARNPELLERFFAEARAVNLIRHENIISVLDLALLPDGRPFIIMEYIDGRTLAQHVRKTAAPLGGVVQVMGEMLSGLAAAHAIGIVHRDLKPDNVLITVEGHAKVLDFGIAKLAPGLKADVSPRTKTGALLGTPAYMAPEQISGAGNVDARTDIYAAGVVLYEAVTGVVPFNGATLFDIMRAHLEEAPRPPSQLRPDLPPAIEQVILQALAKDPAHRFQSAQAMAQALAHAASTLPQSAWAPLSTRGVPRVSAGGYGPSTTEKREPPLEFRSTAAAPPPTAARNRRRGLVIGAIAVAAIVTGIIVIVASSSGSGEAPTSPSPEPVATAPAAATASTPPPAQGSTPPPAQGSTPPPAQGSTPPPAQGSTPPPAPPAPPRTPARTLPAPPATTTPPASVDPPDAGTSGIGSTQTTTMTIGGDGVKVTTTTIPASAITEPADYNPKNFDPVAYLPKALAFARKLVPDARLTSFEFGTAYPDGRVDMTVPGEADNQYTFRSPSKSAGTGERPCMVYLELGLKTKSARIVENDDCNARLVRHPKCSFASVWKQAMASESPPKDKAGRIGWLFDEKWFLDTKTDGLTSFLDKCN